MKITALKIQVRDKNRVNVFVDGKYLFSLEIAQVASLGVKTGNDYTEQELQALQDESQFGKLYGRALEYVFVRPRSQREVRDYLYRKTRPIRLKDGSLKAGASPAMTSRVFNRLVDKGHLDDRRFAEFWVENRNQRKGSSRRKLQAELAAKGVDRVLVDEIIQTSDRHDSDEIQKIIAKKATKYDDPQKLIAYLARQGFSYDDIKTALNEDAAVEGNY